jgi:cysteine desulfurase
MASIYLDNNASTPMLHAVWEAMRPVATEAAANPASSHHAGQRARQALESAREITAAHLGADPDEVVFTSGATEANNLALFGLAAIPPQSSAQKAEGRLGIIASPIEHPCVSEPLQQLRQGGFDLDFLAVDVAGVVQLGDIDKLLQPTPRLVALMLANHETGALQPVRDVIQALAGAAPLHCDAAAAAGKMSIDFHHLGAATLTISAHKFHGPKGIGALLVRRGTKLQPLLYGGHQQQGRRPGTEPVALAVGLATALDLAMRELPHRMERVSRLRDIFLEQCQRHAAPVIVNGPLPTLPRVVGKELIGGLPHTLNLSFLGCQADVLLMNFDLAGICCSTGSACSSGSLLPSPVLQAMGVPPARLQSAMRFSFSHLLTEVEMTEAARRIGEVVRRLRG